MIWFTEILKQVLNALLTASSSSTTTTSSSSTSTTTSSSSSTTMIAPSIAVPVPARTPGVLHHDPLSTQLFTVQLIDGIISITVVLKLNKAVPTSTALIRPGVTEQCTNVIGLNPKIIEPQQARVSLIKAAPGGQSHDLRLSAPQMCWSFDNVIERIISTYSNTIRSDLPLKIHCEK